MHSPHIVEPMNQSLKEKVLRATGESVANCYQCGKCSAGCPLIEEMDIAPNQVLRMLQLGMPAFDDKVLNSMSIWYCLSCQTCFTRCPKDVDLPLIMDYLRSESIKTNKVNPEASNILAFHKTFLNTIKNSGRLHEVSLIAGYKLKSLNLMQDVTVAPTMFFNGKLKILPHSIKGKDAIKRIFEKSAAEMESEK